MTTLEKYIWVVNALYRAGSHGLSLKELSDKWKLDESISYGEPLPRQTFNRWKDNILMSLGVNIDCRLKGGYRYYISNHDRIRIRPSFACRHQKNSCSCRSLMVGGGARS